MCSFDLRPGGIAAQQSDENWNTTQFDYFSASPSSKDDCKKDGWQDYGFKNQGQCIQWVNTGK